MTDHLEEARGYIRANTETGFIIPDRVEASVAIVHALIAIAERIEPQTGAAALSDGLLVRQSDTPATVPVFRRGVYVWLGDDGSITPVRSDVPREAG